MVLRVHGDADGIADHPMVRQRLGPHRIDFESGRLHGSSVDRSFSAQHNGTDSENSEGGGKNRYSAEIDLHGLPPSRSVDILLHASERLSIGLKPDVGHLG